MLLMRMRYRSRPQEAVERVEYGAAKQAFLGGRGIGLRRDRVTTTKTYSHLLFPYDNIPTAFDCNLDYYDRDCGHM